MMQFCQCNDCGAVHEAKDLEPIQNFWQRVSPGNMMPAGECVICGALCYPIKKEEPEHILVFLEGGLINGILTSRPIIYHVLDFDLEGLAEDEIHKLTVYEEEEELWVGSHQKAEHRPDIVKKVVTQLYMKGI
jgi:hypothetical protein